jgi:NRPS condensation-like uncharacterized protein
MDKKCRSLGYLETFTALLHDNCYASLIFGSLSTFHGDLDKQLIQKTLSLLQERHLNLRVKLYKNNEEKYKFTFYTDEKDFSLKIIDDNNPQLANSILEKEMNTPFNLEKFLWRCIICYGGSGKSAMHSIVTVFHHSIADGTSAARFTEDFLYILSCLTKNKHIDLANLPILNCIESNTTKQISWEEYLQRELDNNDLNFKQTTWTYNHKAKLNERKTVVIPKSLEADFVLRLKNKSKKEKVTINATLNAAVFMTFQRLNKEKNDISLNMPTPVNLRVYCDPIINWDNIGNFVLWLPVPVSGKKESTFWDIARLYNKNFLISLEKNGYNPAECDEHYMLDNIISGFDCKDQTPIMFSTITNLGIVKFSNNYAPFILDTFNFTVSQLGGGLAVAIACSTVNGIMHLNFSYTDPLIDRCWIEQFIDDFFISLRGSI